MHAATSVLGDHPSRQVASIHRIRRGTYITPLKIVMCRIGMGGVCHGIEKYSMDGLCETMARAGGGPLNIADVTALKLLVV
jgi:hypothetical protein